MPFVRAGQLDNHVTTIKLRQQLGSVAEALQSNAFLKALYVTLQAWGIGSRASKLKEFDRFVTALRARAHDLEQLDGMRIDDATMNASDVGRRIWRIIDTLSIVENDSTLVSGSKTLHHLLPDLVVPIDRAYTQRFFGWHNPQFQYHQAERFLDAFLAFVRIARRAQPHQFVEMGWNSSQTKVIDNALIGFVISNEGRRVA